MTLKVAIIAVRVPVLCTKYRTTIAANGSNDDSAVLRISVGIAICDSSY